MRWTNLLSGTNFSKVLFLCNDVVALRWMTLSTCREIFFLLILAMKKGAIILCGVFCSVLGWFKSDPWGFGRELSSRLLVHGLRKFVANIIPLLSQLNISMSGACIKLRRYWNSSSFDMPCKKIKLREKRRWKLIKWDTIWCDSIMRLDLFRSTVPSLVSTIQFIHCSTCLSYPAETWMAMFESCAFCWSGFHVGAAMSSHCNVIQVKWHKNELKERVRTWILHVKHNNSTHCTPPPKLLTCKLQKNNNTVFSSLLTTCPGRLYPRHHLSLYCAPRTLNIRSIFNVRSTRSCCLFLQYHMKLSRTRTFMKVEGPCKEGTPTIEITEKESM